MVPVGRLNLLADKMRFFAAVGGVAFAVALILMIQALYSGYRESVKSFVENVPADLWVAQAGAFDLFRSTSIIPGPLASQLSTTPGVLAVGSIRARQVGFMVQGHDVRSLFLSFSPNAEAGASNALGLAKLPDRGQIAISDFVKKKSGLATGDKITINGVDLTVVSELSLKSPPFGSFSVINFEDADEMFSMSGNLSYVLVVSKNPGATVQIAADIRAKAPGVTVFTRSEFARSNGVTINESLPVIGVLLVVSYLVGIVITGLTIYTATIEKARDYGVLKAIGAPNAFIYSVVVHQSLSVSVLGFLIGLPLALLGSQVAAARVPEFITHYTVVAAIVTFLAVVAMGLIASLLPARRVATIDPAIVFRA